MGKRSRESQRQRRSYKKRKIAVECAAKSTLPTNATERRVDAIINWTMCTLQSTSPIPSPTTGLDSESDILDSEIESDAPRPLHSKSVSSWEKDSEVREQRTNSLRPHVHSDERTATVLCASLMEELNETEKFPVIVHENKRKLEVRISDPEVASL